MAARIIVIEDNPTNLELMMYLLQALGHAPVSAMDGSDGLATVRAILPDLVICDLQLPRVDGYEVARRMKSDSRLAGIPLIAVTAFAMPGDRERALSAGFDGYISKPIMPERFMRQIGEFLAQGPRCHGSRTGTEPCEHASRRRATLLLIGEDDSEALHLRTILEGHDFRVFTARDDEAAARIRLSEEVDLVLNTDELAREVAALGESSPAPGAAAPDEVVALVQSMMTEHMRIA